MLIWGGGGHVWFFFHMKPRWDCSGHNHIHKTLTETCVAKVGKTIVVDIEIMVDHLHRNVNV